MNITNKKRKTSDKYRKLIGPENKRTNDVMSHN